MIYTMIRGDCIEKMRALPDASFDMVLTDPPYSSGGLFSGDRKADTTTKYADKDYRGMARFDGFSGDNMDQRSYTEFMRMVFALAREKTKESGIVAVFVDWRNLPALTDALQAAGWVWRGIVVWDKGYARNQPGRFRPDCEFIVWGSNGPKPIKWEPGQEALPGCYRIASVRGNRHHQTEKPVELLMNLLKICPEGGCVLDMFAGAGSTGEACIKTGRDFTLIEINKAIFEQARERVRDVAAQTMLFGTVEEREEEESYGGH